MGFNYLMHVPERGMPQSSVSPSRPKLHTDLRPGKIDSSDGGERAGRRGEEVNNRRKTYSSAHRECESAEHLRQRNLPSLEKSNPIPILNLMYCVRG